jgi:hypothetical protein
MVDDRPEDRREHLPEQDLPEDVGPSPEPSRAKREPPTIDLEATEIPGATPDAEAAAPRRASGVIPLAIVAATTGAVTAALVIAAAWYIGWPGEPAPPPAPAPQVNTEAIDGLAARIAKMESKTVAPAAAASDPAAVARVEALEKSLAALRGELAAARAQSDKLAAAVDGIKSAPAQSSPPPDLSAINARLAQIERTTSAQSAAIAQEGAKIADSKPADDAPLRRVVAAALLDVQVRTGEPFSSTLGAAKSLADNAEALKPLDGFATSGVPNAAALSRELLTLVPKLSPPQPETAAATTGLVDRLKADAVKLIRIERTDAVGTDRGAIVARITAAALRNDIVEARRELNTLSPADRAGAQAWLDKVDARDAALAASRQFAADAMTALAKPGQ